MPNDYRKVLLQMESYLQFLIREMGLDICISGVTVSFPEDVWSRISLYVHTNPLCRRIKAHALPPCTHMQRFVRKRSIQRQGEPFFGCCYAGVGEYVFPVMEGETYVGVFNVSGYFDEAYAARNAEKNTYIRQIYCAHKKSLKPKPDFAHVATLVSPLVHSFKLLYLYTEDHRLCVYDRKSAVYQQLVAFLSTHYPQRLTLESISDELHYSIPYLCRIFKEKNGNSIMQYVQDLRIKRAKLLLTHTDQSVMEISQSVGFDCSNYFTTVFKQTTGVSPRAYRAAK